MAFLPWSRSPPDTSFPGWRRRPEQLPLPFILSADAAVVRTTELKNTNDNARQHSSFPFLPGAHSERSATIACACVSEIGYGRHPGINCPWCIGPLPCFRYIHHITNIPEALGLGVGDPAMCNLYNIATNQRLEAGAIGEPKMLRPLLVDDAPRFAMRGS
jgi:hypothetical protein